MREAATAPSSSSIQVFVRVRPLSNRERSAAASGAAAPCVVVSPDGRALTIASGAAPALATSSSASSSSKRSSATDLSTVGADNSADARNKHTFTFDAVLAPSTSVPSSNGAAAAGDGDAREIAARDDQRRVYDAVARPLLDHAFDGYNVCLFAYGQTGSGKSYTMMGSPTTGHAGVIPRAAAHLFDSIRDRSAADPNIAFNVQASYLEIYMERVRDLLNPGNKEKLRVREHPILGPYVESLSKLILRSDDEVQRVLADGDAVRTVAATKMNDVSSRSHAVFQLILTQTRFDPETRLSTERVSRLSFVDLAGSERANSTGASGVTLREGALINKSLTSLGKVISALADLGGSGGAAGTHVPYRDSVLTWLLKDSLGGNSKTHMISCISPAAINANESLSTLRYSDRAKRIVNQAKVNEDPNAKLIADLKAEIAELRRQLGGTAPGSNVDAGAGVSGDMLQPGAESQLKDQLRSSEKLMLELNETWEEKLRRTQEIYAAKDRILADLGIRVGDGHVGITSPRRHPHLLNQHPNSLSESLVYTLPPGKTDLGSDNKCGIKLDALRPTHAAIYNADRIVLLQPLAGARDVQVNGRCIEKTTILQSGDNVRIATYQFRFVHPRRAAATAAAVASPSTGNMVADPTRGPSATRASPLSMLASRIRDQSQWRRRQRAVLADVRMYAARLKRANVMAREIGINVTYQMHVDPVHARGANPSSAPGAIRVVVRVYDEDAHAVRHWSLKEFARRMPEMETLYAQSSVITAAPVGPRNPFVPGYTRALANVQVSPPATPTHQSSRSSLAFISGGGATSATDDEDDPTGHPPNDAPVADTSTLVGIARVPIDVVPLAGSVEGRVTVVSTLWYQTAIGVLHLGITRRPGAIDVSIMEMNMTARAGQLDAYRLAVRCHRSPTAWTDMMVGFALAESVPFLTSVTIALSSPSSASVRPPDLWIELHAQIVAPLRLWIDAELARAAEADAADALRSARLAAAAARPNSVTAPLGGTTATPTKQLVYANVQVQQLDELGFFAPVPVHQPRENLAAHPPLIRLRHGMIRRIQIAVYAPTDRPVSIASVELGSWRWLVPGAPPIEGGKSLALHKVHEESMVRGDLAVTEAQLAWDSSLHDFFYLNRPTTPTTASDAGMGGGGGGGGSGAGGGMPGGYLQATLGIHTTDGWVLSMQLAFVSTTRGVSGSSGGASAGSESAGMSGELRARSALGVWNVHRSPAHVPVAEYIRGEESLGSFHVLGTKDGGIGLVTGAVAHADWVNRLHEVERTRWWWWTMSRAPPAQQQPRARAMTPPSSGRLSVDSLAGIDSFANTPPHRLRPESRTSDMSDGTLLNTAVAEFLGANPAAAAVRAGFVSAPTSPVHRVFADAGTGPYSLVPPHTPPRPASVPPQTAQLGPGSLLPSAAGSANDLSPVKLPRDHPDAPVIRQQTALALWAQPPLAAVLPASARIRRVIGSGARARDHVTCEQVAGMPGVSRRGFLMMRDPRREPGTGSVVTTVKQQKQAVADAGEGAWIKMWVVIRRPFLVMYESAEEHIEVGFVHLSNAKLRECDAETEFTLEAPKFSYTFRAPSLQDVEAWIGSIDPLYVAAMQSNRRSLADVAGFPFGRRSPRHANGVGGSPGHTGLRERSSIANLAAAFFSVGRRMSSQSLTPP